MAAKFPLSPPPECAVKIIFLGILIPNYSSSPLYVWFLKIMFLVAGSDGLEQHWALGGTGDDNNGVGQDSYGIWIAYWDYMKFSWKILLVLKP